MKHVLIYRLIILCPFFILILSLSLLLSVLLAATAAGVSLSARCIAVCVRQTIGYCYKRCSEDTRPLSAWRPLVQRQDPSLRINLICRDSTNLIIEIKPTALEAGGGVGGNHHQQDSKLTPKLSAPGGNQNQLNALRDRSASAESLESAAPARSRRAIGADGPLPAGQLTERQKASSGTRTNLLQPTAGKIDGPTLHGSVDAAAHEDDDTDDVAVKVQPDREHYQRALAAEQDRTRPPVPIYLVKVQDSEQELGDRIVYMVSVVN